MKRKIYIFIQIIILSVFLLGNANQNITILSQTTNTVFGATHERVQRTLNVSGTQVLQTYHYLGADFSTDDFRIITGDDYSQTAFRLASTKKHAEVSQSKYDDYFIIGGVNADFFAGSQPIEAYIEDGQVIASGQGFNREVIGFKKNGGIAMGTPTFDGYEIIIKDHLGKERIRLPIKNINASFVNHPYDIFVYFDTYTTQLSQGIPKYVIQTSETKGALPKLFGTGTVVQSQVLSSMQTPSGHLTVMSHNPYLKSLISLGDTVVVQRKLTGDFEGVEWAVGGWGKLVIDGMKNTNIVSVDPTVRAPRTAIGVKQDGSVFFVAVDGRQSGYSQGITLYELADLMMLYGAHQAYNLDGGGSTTMVIRDESDGFDVVNQPSDGTLRNVTNSVFLAIQVRFDDSEPYPVPDLSVTLDAPTQLNVIGKTLSFTGVPGTTSYEISINDQIYTTKLTSFDLSTVINTPSNYTLYVKSIGDGFYYKTSAVSQPYQYTYNGPEQLTLPNQFRLSSTTLYWDESQPYSNYSFSVGDKNYTLFLNRFNLATLSLTPGIYEISIRKIGDGYLTSDSDVVVYRYRVYSATEKEVLATIDLIKELFVFGNR
jgi:hypothetical protein